MKDLVRQLMLVISEIPLQTRFTALSSLGGHNQRSC
jgi:hypothetical protein